MTNEVQKQLLKESEEFLKRVSTLVAIEMDVNMENVYAKEYSAEGLKSFNLIAVLLEISERIEALQGVLSHTALELEEKAEKHFTKEDVYLACKTQCLKLTGNKLPFNQLLEIIMESLSV